MSTQSKLTGRDKDLGGGFMVRRLLPAAQRQSVGPFLFFDHSGPLTVEPGVSHDVRPHPHIGLATVTYLLPALADELAIYPVDGGLSIDGEPVAARTLAILAPGAAVQVSSSAPTRLVVIGGDALDGHRSLWWNFVSSRKQRIAHASEDWAAQNMGQVPGETEFIPLP